MSPSASTNSLFNLLKFTTGRRLFAYGQVLKLLGELGIVRLRDFVEEGVQKDRALRALEARYRQRRAADKQPRGQTQQLNYRVGRAVGVLFSLLNDVVDVDPGSDEAVIAASLASEFFPEGAAAVTRLPFEDELSACENILERAHGDLAPDIARVGATLLVDKLDKHVRAFAAELRQFPKMNGPSWDAVCTKRRAAQSHLERFVAKVWGDDELTDAQRTSLLGPVLRQNDAISAHYSRRRWVPDVDPETGDEVTDDANDESVAETETSAKESATSDAAEEG